MASSRDVERSLINSIQMLERSNLLNYAWFVDYNYCGICFSYCRNNLEIIEVRKERIEEVFQSFSKKLVFNAGTIKLDETN